MILSPETWLRERTNPSHACLRAIKEGPGVNTHAIGLNLDSYSRDGEPRCLYGRLKGTRAQLRQIAPSVRSENVGGSHCQCDGPYKKATDQISLYTDLGSVIIRIYASHCRRSPLTSLNGVHTTGKLPVGTIRSGRNSSVSPG